MKPVLEKVGKKADQSFQIECNSLPYFISPWHFHPEIEIILIENGTGTVFAGDFIQKFKPGTLAIIGPNLPHVWLNDKEYYEKKSKLVAESIVLKFDEDIFGSKFMELPEMLKIRNLILHSGRGMLFTGKTQEKLKNQIHEIILLHEFERINSLLSILNICSQSSEYTFMASASYSNSFNQTDCDRIDKVYKYVMNNFAREIELKEVADIANLSPTAFCRYFKTRTLKPFSKFLNEIRVGYACKFLIEKKLSISEICYKSGFNYPSNFHKQFRNVMKVTPLEYQKKYWK